MLDLLYHKRNPLIITVVNGIIFFKYIYDYNLKEKRYKKILFLLRYYNDETIINTNSIPTKSF